MSKIKVIIIEDEAIFALDLKYKLINLGYEVTSLANNYSAAIFAIKKETPDLALVDINIKGIINGIETALYLREFFNIPSLFISSQNDNETREKASKIHPIGFLSKPLNDSQFQKVMLNFQRNLHNFTSKNTRNL